MSEGPRTVTMRAMSATAAWLDRLGKWWKRALVVGAVLIAARGLYEWGETAYQAIGDVGPHLVQFRAHRGDFNAHVEVFESHEQAHEGEHGEFNQLSDTLLRSLDGITDRLDATRRRQEWLLCLEGQARDRDAGRPVRDCTEILDGGS